MENCIEANKLTKVYHGRTVVDALSFSVKRGEVFGLLMASLCRRVKTTNAVTSLVYFPMLFLSGATIPYELFPEGLQRVADFLPLTQGIKLMKAVSMGESLDSVLKIIILLATVTVVCTAVSVKTFRWE